MTFNYLQKFTAWFSVFYLITAEAYCGQYSLFNPVPKNEMRDMTTERPSKADSSYTIDSGHMQIESSLYYLQKNKNAQGRVSNESVLHSTTFRLGVNQSTEVQLIISPVTWRENVDYSDDVRTNQTGFGDSVVRVKYNMMGNDGGDASLAVIPFVKIPTNSNGLSNSAFEGGVSVPFDLALQNGYSFNYTVQAMALRRSDVNRIEPIFANMFVLGKSFNEKVSGYVEYFAQQITDDADESTQSLDFGVVYALTKDITVDGAVNFGLSNRSDDVEILFGGAYRF